MPILKRIVLAAALVAAVPPAAWADDLACINTAFRVLGADDRVCVSVFDDPEVPGVSCYIAQARTGGVKGSLGLAEDPSRFSLTCQQVGPVTTDLKALKDKEAVFSEHTSIFFKHTRITRVVDRTRNTLIYMAISDKLIDGSPQSALASVSIVPWGQH
jgi:CreA protein